MQASEIQLRSVPRHLAIIMDGNNRWARREGYPGVAGHRAGAEVVREIVSACEARGIRYLTLFAFSSENWGRPRAEVRALLALLSRYLRNEVTKLKSDGVRLRVIGRRDRFSPHLQRLIASAEKATEAEERATLTLALDYGGRWDVAQVTRSIALDCAERGVPIRANMVHPGAIRTPMYDRYKYSGADTPENIETNFAATHPMNRIGEPEEVAKAVVFLASDEASFTTGCDFTVDGGGSIRS